MLVILGHIGYYAATTISWCADNEIISGRKNCKSDEACAANGRETCDKDPNCYGIAWYEVNLSEDLRMCKSNRMEPKTDGWRTMMKEGISTAFFI